MAASAIGWDNIICIINQHYGEISNLPFDLKSRRVCSYTLAKDGEKKVARATLVKSIRAQIEHSLTALNQAKNAVKVKLIDCDENTELDTQNAQYFNYVEPMSKNTFLATAKKSDFGIEDGLGSNSLSMLQKISKIKLRNHSDFVAYLSELFHENDKVNTQLHSNAVLVRSVSRHENINYFDEVAYYISTRRLVKPLRIAVGNGGKSSLRHAKIVLEIEDSPFVRLYDSRTIPDKPQRSNFVSLPKNSFTPDTQVESRIAGKSITAEIDLVRPGQVVELESEFYFGVTCDCDLTIAVIIYADNIQPIHSELQISCIVSKVEMSVEDLVKYAQEECDSR